MNFLLIGKIFEIKFGFLIAEDEYKMLFFLNEISNLYKYI